ncbi:MAG: carbohydrate binding domain-containing protein [Planctomycetota bacterium]
MSVDTLPVAGSSEGQRGRRSSRLHELVRVPHAIGFMGLLYSIIVLTLSAYLTMGAGGQVFLHWTAIATIGFAVHALSSGNRISATFCVILSLAMFSMVTMVGESIVNLGRFGMFFKTAGAMQFYALVAVLVLSSIGLMRPATSALFFLTVALAFSFANAWFQKPASENEIAGPTVIHALPAGNHVLPQRPKQDQPDWIGQGARPHPTLEYVYQPNLTFKTVYPSNPRGYFQVEDVYGPLDMRMGYVFNHAGAQAEIQIPADRNGSVRVIPKATGNKQPWQINFQYNGIPLVEGRRYAVSFTAKADAPRPMEYGMFRMGKQQANVGLHQTVKLTTEWQTFRHWFSSKETLPSATLMFLIGQDSTAVEVGNITVAPTYMDESGSVDMRMWSMIPRDGGKLTSPSEPSGAMRVEVAKADPNVPYAVQVVQDCYPLHKDHHYNITFRARADKPRPLELVLIQSQPSWNNLGLHLRLELTEDWQVFAGEFRGVADDPNARLVFNAAASAVPFEIADLLLWSEQSEPPAPPPQRYTVEYSMNAEGFRDRDRLPGKQEGIYRVACLGDSFTFGQGVHEPDTFVRRIENLLNADKPANVTMIDVMNFGICGFCTWQERKLYNEIAAKYEPDLVLVTMVHNDHLSPGEEAKLGLNANQQPAAGGNVLGNLQKAFENVKQTQSFDYTRCVEELKLLQEDCKKRNAKLAVIIYRDGIGDNWIKLEKQVTEGMKQTGVPVLSLGNTLTVRPFSTLKVHDVDNHPNDMSHGIASEAIVKFLRDNKLVPTK